MHAGSVLEAVGVVEGTVVGVDVEPWFGVGDEFPPPPPPPHEIIKNKTKAIT